MALIEQGRREAGVIGRVAFILTLCARRALLWYGDETTTGRPNTTTTWEAQQRPTPAWRAKLLWKHATHAHTATPVRKRALPSGENGVAAYRRWGVGITGKSVRETWWGLARQRRSPHTQTYRVSAGGASQYRSVGFRAAARRASSVAAHHDSARRRSGVGGVAGVVAAVVNLPWERRAGWLRQSHGAAADSSLVPP